MESVDDNTENLYGIKKSPLHTRVRDGLRI